MAGSLAAAAVLASVLAVVAVWQPSQLPMLFTPAEGAAAGTPDTSDANAPTANPRERFTIAEPVATKPSPSADQPADQPAPGPSPTGDSPGTPTESTPPPAAPPPPPEAPEVQLVAAHSGKCLDVFGARTSDGALVVQSECHSQGSQHFQLVDAGTDHVTIRASHSGKCLGVEGGSRQDKAAIVQLTCTGAASQQFRPGPVGGGLVQFVLRHSGKCLDVFGESRENQAPLIQWPCHGNANQRWERNPA